MQYFLHPWIWAEIHTCYLCIPPRTVSGPREHLKPPLLLGKVLQKSFWKSEEFIYTVYICPSKITFFSSLDYSQLLYAPSPDLTTPFPALFCAPEGWPRWATCPRLTCWWASGWVWVEEGTSRSRECGRESSSFLTSSLSARYQRSGRGCNPGWPQVSWWSLLCECVLSHISDVQLIVTLWIVVCQGPLSMGFSRKEYWSGWPYPPPGDLPDPRIKPTSLMSPALAGGFFPTRPHGKPGPFFTRLQSHYFFLYPFRPRGGNGFLLLLLISGTSILLVSSLGLPIPPMAVFSLSLFETSE